VIIKNTVNRFRGKLTIHLKHFKGGFMQLMRVNQKELARSVESESVISEVGKLPLEKVIGEIQRVVQPETREILERLPGYNWERWGNRLRALAAMEGMAYGHYNRLPEQTRMHEKRFVLHSNLDLSQKLVPILWRIGANKAKLFAVTEGVKGGDGAVIGGPDFDWKLERLENSKSELPIAAQQILARMRSGGLEFPGYHLAKPGESKAEDFVAVLGQETALALKKGLARLQSTADMIATAGKKMGSELAHIMRDSAVAFEPHVYRDPVLLASFGHQFRFYLELCRWK
jgi:hypothetical protein